MFLGFYSVTHALPSMCVTNNMILDWVEKHNVGNLSPRDLKFMLQKSERMLASAGTQVRYIRDAKERASDICIKAAREAIEIAEVCPREIDMVIYAGVSKGFTEPATAHVFQDQLGCENAACFDVGDACASWLRAIDLARAYLKADCCKKIMIVNGEFNFKEIFPNNINIHSLQQFDYWFPSLTIGEAATCSIIGRSSVDDLYKMEFKAWGSRRKLCMIPLPNLEEFIGEDVADHYKPFHFISYGTKLMRFAATKIVEQYRKNDEVGLFQTTNQNITTKTITLSKDYPSNGAQASLRKNGKA